MPGIRFTELIARFTADLERAGATVLLASPDQDRRARRLRVVTGGATTECLVFLWTITPGGGGTGVRPAHERRIQITNVPRFPFSPGIRTIVGGWSPEESVWAFWDPRRHSRFSPRSPSLQIPVETLQAAGREGLATHLRLSSEGREVIVAVNSGSLPWYVQEGEPIHNADEDAHHVGELLATTPEFERNLIDSSSTPDEAARRYELVQTMRAFRDARFRPAVLRAYAYCCAVCGTGLRLVDAAHIVPVTHPQGTDEVTNGLALCRLHHAAYDTGLLGVRSDYRLVLNDAVVARLQGEQLASGLPAFREALPERIRVPAAAEHGPNPAKLRLGMEIRQFPPILIG